MRKSTKGLSLFLAVLMLFSVFPTSVFAIDWNGDSSGSSSGTPNNVTDDNFWVYPGNKTSDCVGYRFSVVNAAGTTIKQPIDIYRDLSQYYEGSQMHYKAYSDFEKCTVKKNKVDLINGYSSFTFKTTKNTDSCYKEKDLSITLPNPSGMGTWQNTTANLKPVLVKLGYTNGVSDLPYGARILVEPIWKMVLHGYWQCLTVSELAVYGIKKKGLGLSSCGGDPDGGTSFGSISYYTNNVWPNELRTGSDDGLTNLPWGETDEIAKGNADDWNKYINKGAGAYRKNFEHLLKEGYGVGVAFTSTYNKPNTITINADGHYGSTGCNMYDATGGKLNVFLSTSSTSNTKTYTMSYDSTKEAYFKKSISAGTYYVWASLADEATSQIAYTGKSFTIKASDDNKTQTIDYYYVGVLSKLPAIASIKTKITKGSATYTHTMNATSSSDYDTFYMTLSGASAEFTANVAAASTDYTYSFSKFTGTNKTSGANTDYTTQTKTITVTYPILMTAYGTSTLMQWNATFKTNGGKWHDTGNTNDEVIAYKVNDSVVPGTDRGYLVKDYNHFKSWKVTAADNTSWGTVNSAQHWNTSDPTNSKFTVKKSTDKYTGNVTLTAQWELNKLHVSYYTEKSGTYTIGSGYKLVNGKICTSSGSTYYDVKPYDNNLALMTAANFGLDRAGYTFEGWKLYYWDSEAGTSGKGYPINDTVYTSIKFTSWLVGKKTSLRCSSKSTISIKQKTAKAAFVCESLRSNQENSATLIQEDFIIHRQIFCCRIHDAQHRRVQPNEIAAGVDQVKKSKADFIGVINLN